MEFYFVVAKAFFKIKCEIKSLDNVIPIYLKPFLWAGQSYSWGQVEISIVVQEKIISPWKRMGHSFEQTWFPLTNWCFVPSLVEIDPVVLEKKMKLWKVYDNDNTDDDNTDNNNDDDGQRTNFDQKSSLEPRSAPVS